jgi:hypothetical protein
MTLLAGRIGFASQLDHIVRLLHQLGGGMQFVHRVFQPDNSGIGIVEAFVEEVEHAERKGSARHGYDDQES